MNRKNYSNFDLDFYKAENEYIVKVRSITGETKQTFSAPFARKAAEKFILTVQNSIGSDSQDIRAVKNFGGTLFETVFQKDVRALYKSSLDVVASQEGAGLRVLLHLQDVPDLAHLPWEYLYQAKTNQFLCLNRQTPIVRYLDIPKIITPLNIKLPLRILVFISSPTNLVQLDVNNESQKIQKALADLEKKGLVNFTFCENATVSELIKNLRQSEFHIFHFIGHGGFYELKNQGLLAFENEDESADYVSAEQLGPMLTNHRFLRLVVLNSCEGARTSIADPFAGVATTLVQQGIPAVLAMQFSITDIAAIHFIEEFYASIADGLPVDAAVTDARVNLFSSVDNTIEWGTPVLFMRSSDGELFTIESRATSQEIQKEKSLWKISKPSFTILFAIATIIFGLIAFIILSVIPKSTVIGIDVYAKRVSFSLLAESSGEEVPLLYSGIWTNSISVENFQTISLNLDAEFMKSQNYTLHNPITIMPNSINGRVTFQSSAPDMSLQEVISDSGSIVSLQLNDENIVFEIQKSTTNPFELLSLGEYVTIFAQECTVTDELKHDLTQQFFIATPAKLQDISRSIHIQGQNGALVTIIDDTTEASEEPMQFILEELVENLKFTKAIHQNFRTIEQSTIDSVVITRNFPLNDMTFKSKGTGDLQIETAPNRFLIYDFSRIDNSLRVKARGRLKNFKVGQGSLMREMVPGYLAFITHHPTTSLLITVVGWLITILGPIILKSRNDK
jgi:hypothetical protein